MKVGTRCASLSGVLMFVLLASAPGAQLHGPYQSTQRTNQTTAAHFYIHNATGAAFDVRVRCTSMLMANPDWAAFPRLMVRVFDADERRIFRGHVAAPELTEREGLPQEVTVSVPVSEPGVVQVVVSGGRSPKSVFDLTTEPALPFGMMGSIKVIVPPKGGISEGFVYVPPGARELKLEAFDADVTVRHERGIVRVADRKKATVPIRETDVLWRISVKPRRWPGAKVITDGFPVIVCPDEATARAIAGSVERLDDGSLVAHKFQVRLDRLVRETFKSPDDFALPAIESFEPMIDALLADMRRNQHLVVGYTPPLPFLNLWTQRQVLDPKSPYFGGIHAVCTYGGTMARYQIPGNSLSTGKAPPSVPPMTDEAAHDLWASFSPRGYPAGLAFVYSLDPKLSPWHHNRRLLNRVIIAACRDMMLLNESEVVQARPSDWMGCFAFVFRYRFTDAYGFVGQAVKEHYPEIHREWTEGLMRFADRLAYMSVFAPANQAAHIPMGLWRVHQGSGDEFYREQTRYTAQRICDVLQKPAGYQVEGYGPCGSYNGITLDLWATLHYETQMPLFLDSLRKAFHCFNHTVAPEPSGQLIGVTDLNHRVQMPWTYTQHGGGKAMLVPLMKEAGVWRRKQPTAADDAKLAADIRVRAKIIPYSMEQCAKILGRRESLGSGSSMRSYQYYTAGVMSGGLFPFEEEPFLRNLGDEFICVKQPSYYCLVYVGKPGIGSWLRPPAAMKSAARTGGGISLLWTPDYGVALAGQGWNSYCHHGPVVDLGGDKVRTADYFAVEFDLDEEARQLVVRGKVKEVPLRYQHTYRFGEASIRVGTRVEADDAISAQSCALQFPIFASKERGFRCAIAGGEATQVALRDGTGGCVTLRFDELVRTSWGRTSKQKVYPVEYAIRQLKVDMPKEWQKGQVWLADYEIGGGTGSGLDR